MSFETWKQKQIGWRGIVLCVRKRNYILTEFCKEQREMSFSVNLEYSFVNIKEVNQRHVETALAEDKHKLFRERTISTDQNMKFFYTKVMERMVE